MGLSALVETVCLTSVRFLNLFRQIGLCDQRLAMEVNRERRWDGPFDHRCESSRPDNSPAPDPDREVGRAYDQVREQIERRAARGPATRALMARDPASRRNSDETGLQKMIRQHVAFVWIIVSLLAVLVFAYAMNLAGS